MYDPGTKKIYVRSNVKFIEKMQDSLNNLISIPVDLSTPATTDKITQSENRSTTEEDRESTSQIDSEAHQDRDHMQEEENGSTETEDSTKTSQRPRRSKRIRKKPAKLDDYCTYLANLEQVALEDYKTYTVHLHQSKLNNYEMSDQEFNLDEDNLNFDEAIERGWRCAIKEEVNNILQNKTWEIIEDTEQDRIDVVWKFRTKLYTEGKKIRKARIVARGCKQNRSESAYAHVPGMTTVAAYT